MGLDDRTRDREADDCIKGGSGRDVIDCAPGEDAAKVDATDVVRGCERVRRSG